jgi:DNA-directed RNA polymerase specialized sigma24 family protein
MSARTHIPVRRDEASPYSNSEDFQRIFIEDLDGLYQLSFLLTADQTKAEKCFVSGIEDCVNENRVFKEWARSWAKRTIIQNAIRELKPRPSHSRSSQFVSVSSHTQQSNGSVEHFEADAVFRLADFDRFVFVMSVLEHYTQHDCALLLGCSISEVRDARVRTLEDLAGAHHALSFNGELSHS